jgi:hypothetical protein
MDGPEANIRADIDRVLATTWDAEDWLAVARDPANLRDEPISAESLTEWVRRLTAVGERG